jgi:hypothetical protein
VEQQREGAVCKVGAEVELCCGACGGDQSGEGWVMLIRVGGGDGEIEQHGGK